MKKTVLHKIESWSREDLVSTVMRMASFAGWSLAIVWFLYLFRFGPLQSTIFGAETSEQIINAKAAWGQLGDFIGGTLNPVLTGLTLIGLIFTILLQHEAMVKAQEENKENSVFLKKQLEFSLISARLQSLTAALEVITEMHRQAAEKLDPSAIELLERKTFIAREILAINESLSSSHSA